MSGSVNGFFEGLKKYYTDQYKKFHLLPTPASLAKHLLYHCTFVFDNDTEKEKSDFSILDRCKKMIYDIEHGC